MDAVAHPGAVRRLRRRPGGELPALDGIRAVAVVAVLLYHFGVGAARGGFLGVDVFFVLSGYLITGQLVTRWVLTGAISLRSFWMARARRLLPGLGALLVGTTTAVLLLDRSQVGLFRGDVTAAATYSSNWWYIFHHRSYFVAAGRPPLLQHLWSLAVEEQFYLVWPLVVAAVVTAFASVETRRRVLIAAALSIAAASSLLMGLGSALSSAPEAGDPSRWYFGSDSHVMGLLIGAALALWRRGDNLGADRVVAKAPTNRWDTALGVSAFAILLAALSQTDQFSIWLYRWGFLAVSLLTAAVVAVATRPGPLASTLSAPVLRGVGRRSYALYLWHWPIACFTRPGIDLPLPYGAVLVLRLALTFLVAEASYRWIELPVRQRGWHRFWRSVAGSGIGVVRAPTIITVFVTSLVTAVMVMPATAAPQGRTLTSGGTVYVGDPGRPGSVHVDTTHPLGIQLPAVPSSPATTGPHSPPTELPPPPTAPPHSTSELKSYDLAVYGDSVALGAVPDLAETFRSVTNNATDGIQAWTLLPELTADAEAGRLNHDIVLIHTGDNGVVSSSELDAALTALSGATRVILAVPYVPREWQSDNQSLVTSVAGRYPNVTLMDWETVVRAHADYVWSDGIHLTPTGEHAYAALVAGAAVVH